MAVGYTVSSNSQVQSLIERWDGTSWTVFASSDPGSTEADLDGVSCSNESDCVAVGYAAGGGSQGTLVETWDGRSWSMTPSPSPGADDNLTSVSCSGPANCVAVGTANNPSTATLVESWNGTSWAVEPSPNPGTSENELDSVTCLSSSRCIAVGRQVNGPMAQTLVETLSGHGWSVSQSPSIGNTDALMGVSCARVSSCTAVGYDSNGSGETLVEHWDGRSWTVVPSPDPSGFGPNGLSSVSCTGSTSCVAVGQALGLAPNGTPNGSAPQVLIETWNGRAWAVTGAPNPATESSAFLGVSCALRTGCTAVGYLEGAGPQTLVESDLVTH